MNDLDPVMKGHYGMDAKMTLVSLMRYEPHQHVGSLANHKNNIHTAMQLVEDVCNNQEAVLIEEPSMKTNMGFMSSYQETRELLKSARTYEMALEKQIENQKISDQLPVQKNDRIILKRDPIKEKIKYIDLDQTSVTAKTFINLKPIGLTIILILGIILVILGIPVILTNLIAGAIIVMSGITLLTVGSILEDTKPFESKNEEYSSLYQLDFAHVFETDHEHGQDNCSDFDALEKLIEEKSRKGYDEKTQHIINAHNEWLKESIPLIHSIKENSSLTNPTDDEQKLMRLLSQRYWNSVGIQYQKISINKIHNDLITRSIEKYTLKEDETHE